MPDEIILKYRLKKNETFYYCSKLEILNNVIQNGEIKSAKTLIENKIRHKVTDIDSFNNITIEITTLSSLMIRDGVEEIIPVEGQFFTMQIEDSGKIISTSSQIPFSHPYFPDHPIKPGDIWKQSTKISVPIKDEPVEIFYDYTYTGNFSQNNQNYATIQIICPQTKIELHPENFQYIESKGFNNYSLETGMLFNSQVETDSRIIFNEVTTENMIRINIEQTSEGE